MFHYVQSFNAVANQVCNSLMFLAVVGLTLPVAAANLAEIHFTDADMLIFSRIIAVLLLATYITYLYFQLQSHSDLFKADKTQARAFIPCQKLMRMRNCNVVKRWCASAASSGRTRRRRAVCCRPACLLSSACSRVVCHSDLLEGGQGAGTPLVCIVVDACHIDVRSVGVPCT